MGTFTHRTEYLPALLESVKRHLPHIPFVVQMHAGPILTGMELLRQVFLATDKRYWIFLDDDIQFLCPGIVHRAIGNLIANRWAAIGVYSTFDPRALSVEYDTSDAGMRCRAVKWLPGYFIAVDSHKVGDVAPDPDLPDPNTAIDTTYSVAIQARGWKIGISPDIVYHARKEVWLDAEAMVATNEYLARRWGDFYFNRANDTGCVIQWPA